MENITNDTSGSRYVFMDSRYVFILCVVLVFSALSFMAFQFEKAIKESSRQLTNVEIADLLKTEDDCVVGKLRDEAESYVLVVRDLDDARIACREQASLMKWAKEYEQKRKQQNKILLSGPEH